MAFALKRSSATQLTGLQTSGATNDTIRDQLSCTGDTNSGKILGAITPELDSVLGADQFDVLYSSKASIDDTIAALKYFSAENKCVVRSRFAKQLAMNF